MSAVGLRERNLDEVQVHAGLGRWLVCSYLLCIWSLVLRFELYEINPKFALHCRF